MIPVHEPDPGHFREALDSILGQTYKDFEAIVVVDGPQSKEVEEVYLEYDRKHDLRIFILSQNQGVAKALNYGLLVSRSEYIARMDADDISMPDRFEKQVNFLDANPKIGVLGTRFWSMSEDMSRVIWKNDVPLDPEGIRKGLEESCCMGHPTVMMRRSVVESIGGYSEAKEHKAIEDYELWKRAVARFDMANLPDYLLKYREHDGQVTKKLREVQQSNLARL